VAFDTTGSRAGAGRAREHHLQRLARRRHEAGVEGVRDGQESALEAARREQRGGLVDGLGVAATTDCVFELMLAMTA